jgi:hypothetical protein
VVVRGGEVLAAAATVAQYIAHAAGAAVAGFRENREEAKKRRKGEGRGKEGRREKEGRRKGEGREKQGGRKGEGRGKEERE